MGNKNKSSSPFKGLRQALQARKRKRDGLMKKDPEQPCKEAAPLQPSPPLPSEEELFHQAMGDVREIPSYREMTMPCGKSTKPPLRQAPRRYDDTDETMQELDEIVRGKRGITLKDTDEYMEWAKPGLTRSKKKELTRGLHEGVYAIGDYIDLHGLTEDEAWDALEKFLLNARRRKLACIKIIHGRGLRSPHGPVLKGAVARWLRNPLSKYVLAFATARACDGGLGATYVLLRK